MTEQKSPTYADAELRKVNPRDTTQIKIRGQNGETRWMTLTPETLAKVAKVLRQAPEMQWL